MSVERKNTLVYCIDYPGGLWKIMIFQFVGGNYPVTGTHHHRRGIEVIKCKGGYILGHIVQEGSAGIGIAGHDQSAGLLNRFYHRFIIKRHKAARIYYLGADAVSVPECVCCLKGTVKGGANGKDGNIFSLQFYVRFPERDLVISGRNASLVKMFANIIDPLTFKEDHRVGSLQG
jgi:hypothetical protein